VATVQPPAPSAASERRAVVTTPARTHGRRGLLLLGLAAFQFWLWGTRIWNLVRDAQDVSTAFVAVHAVLYVAAIGAGVILAVVGARMWRESRASGASGASSASGGPEGGA
jgi:uncharacterized membrane protein YgcG